MELYPLSGRTKKSLNYYKSFSEGAPFPPKYHHFVPKVPKSLVRLHDWSTTAEICCIKCQMCTESPCLVNVGISINLDIWTEKVPDLENWIFRINMKKETKNAHKITNFAHFSTISEFLTSPTEIVGCLH